METFFPFQPNLGDSSSTTGVWTEFKEWFHNYFLMQFNNRVEDIKVGVNGGSVLLHLCGQEISKILEGASHKNGTDVEDGTVLMKQLEKIENLCFPKFLVLFQRFQFFTCKQMESEKMCKFLVKLDWLSEFCEFASEKENCVSQQIIKGVFDEELRQDLRQAEHLDVRNMKQMCRKTDKRCWDMGLCCNLSEHENENLKIFTCFDLGYERDLFKTAECEEAEDLNGMQNEAHSIEMKPSIFHCNLKQSLIHDVESKHLPVSKEITAPVLPDISTGNFDLTEAMNENNDFSDEMDDNDVSIDTEKDDVDTSVDTFEPIMKKNEDDDTIVMYDKEMQTRLMAGSKMSSAVDLKESRRKDEELMTLIQQRNVFILDDIVRTVLNVSQPSFLNNSRTKFSMANSQTKTTTASRNLNSVHSAKYLCSSQTTGLNPLHDNTPGSAVKSCDLVCDQKESINNVKPQLPPSDLPACEEDIVLVLPHVPTFNSGQTTTTNGKNTSIHFLTQAEDDDEQVDPIENHEDEDTIDMYDREIQTGLMAGEKMAPALDLKQNKRNDDELISLIQQENVFILDDVVDKVVRMPEPEFHYYNRTKLCMAGSQTTTTTSTKLYSLKPLINSETKTNNVKNSISHSSFSGKSDRPHLKGKWNKILKKFKMFYCHLCEEGFSSSLKCYQHVRESHPEQVPHKCDQCDKRFILETSLAEHKLIHTADQKATCPKCSAKFESVRILEKHLSKDHRHDRHTCKTCGQKFRFMFYLKEHEMKHTGERPFVCEVCGTTYALLANLKRHMKIHDPEAGFKCPHCPRVFNYKFNLKTHIARHFGIKKFVCHLCGLKFITSTAMKDHVKVHNGERPFQCSSCDKAFVTSGHLKRHKRIHTKEKRYRCNICGSLFTRLTNMRSHQRSIHGINTSVTPNQKVTLVKA